MSKHVVGRELHIDAFLDSMLRRCAAACIRYLTSRY